MRQKIVAIATKIVADTHPGVTEQIFSEQIFSEQMFSSSALSTALFYERFVFVLELGFSERRGYPEK